MNSCLGQAYLHKLNMLAYEVNQTHSSCKGNIQMHFTCINYYELYSVSGVFLILNTNYFFICVLQNASRSTVHHLVKSHRNHHHIKEDNITEPSIPPFVAYSKSGTVQVSNTVKLGKTNTLYVIPQNV